MDVSRAGLGPLVGLAGARCSPCAGWALSSACVGGGSALRVVLLGCVCVCVCVCVFGVFGAGLCVRVCVGRGCCVRVGVGGVGGWVMYWPHDVQC